MWVIELTYLLKKKVIIEVKSVENLAPVHYSQLLTYLKLSNKKLGLLINFNSKILKNEIHRVVNNLLMVHAKSAKKMHAEVAKK